MEQRPLATASHDVRSTTSDDALGPSSHIHKGTVIADKYKLSEVLGEGGVGIVYHATHVALGQAVAVKMLRPEAMAIPTMVERFTREARVAAMLQSEHVVKVFDVGITAEGVPFMVMERLEGRDLARVLEADGPIPVAQAVRYVLQACDALSEAHSLGIVHRDIKPENIFLVERAGHLSRIKVLDFGISKVGPGSIDGFQQASRPASDDPTRTVMVMGSPRYMSPEQLRSTSSVDLRADIWSLGVVLFELLTGRSPFEGRQNFADMSAAILREPALSLRALAPHLPAELARLVERCLDKNRAGRYGSAAELAHAIAPFADTSGAVDKARGPLPEPRHRARIVDDLTRLLTLRTGPFAKIHVQRALSAMGASARAMDAADGEDLALRLATKVAAPSERRRFLDEALACIYEKSG
ncbi:MAG TPA: serine/threonine-protein kinase [Polyangiaceae bacterium]|nr:serine/threonine-protein kinase [Polyangiaceae bacterium]